MSVLHTHHILPLYAWVDDALALTAQTLQPRLNAYRRCLQL